MEEIDKLKAVEAKAIVALAFRNGPIENLHAGKSCPLCHGDSKYSHITDDEMREVMKYAVNQMYKLLMLRRTSRGEYIRLMDFGATYTRNWNDPEDTEMAHNVGERATVEAEAKRKP